MTLPSATLNESGALSALIKCIRLRRTDEAAVWLLATWRASADLRRRAQRRLLVAAAEDNLSIAVMHSVSSWYHSRARFDLQAAVGVLLRIVRTPNWYATREGRAYIRCWYEALRDKDESYREQSADSLMATIENAVREKQLGSAIRAFDSLYAKAAWNRWGLAELLTRLALESHNRPAIELADLFKRSLSDLWNDGNYSGQALYTLIAGPFSIELVPTVEEEEVGRLLGEIERSFSSGLSVPDWAKDGIHLPGNDPRFSGSIRFMAAACTAFERFGRVHPDDDWSSILVEDSSGS